MDHRLPDNFKRMLLLVLFLAAVLAVYLGVLYDIQVRNHDHYLAQSIRTITREETVEASRGIITDRMGKTAHTDFSGIVRTARAKMGMMTYNIPCQRVYFAAAKSRHNSVYFIA